MGKFLIGYKKYVCFLIGHEKKFNFPIDPWVDFFPLIDHLSVKVGEQMPFMPLSAFLCLTFLLTMKLDNMSFKM
jgi:hypothetical protein